MGVRDADRAGIVLHSREFHRAASAGQNPRLAAQPARDAQRLVRRRHQLEIAQAQDRQRYGHLVVAGIGALLRRGAGDGRARRHLEGRRAVERREREAGRGRVEREAARPHRPDDARARPRREQRRIPGRAEIGQVSAEIPVGRRRRLFVSALRRPCQARRLSTGQHDQRHARAKDRMRAPGRNPRIIPRHGECNLAFRERRRRVRAQRQFARPGERNRGNAGKRSRQGGVEEHLAAGDRHGRHVCERGRSRQFQLATGN